VEVNLDKLLGLGWDMIGHGEVNLDKPGVMGGI
jgi:hypothetical protein